MRTKTRLGGRPKPCTSPSATTNRALPLFHDQPEDFMQTIMHEMSGACNEGLHDDVAVNLNEDTVDCMEIDSFKERTCIRCNRGGDVLVCREIGCPIALHDKCVCFKPKFDAFGRFYCPYCSYKRTMVETGQFRKKAMLAKKALLKFVGANAVGGNGQNLEDNGEAKRKESNVSLPHVRNQNSPDHEKCVWVEDLQDDRCEAHDRVIDELHTKHSIPNSCSNVHFREEEIVLDFTEEKSNDVNISEAHLSDFIEDGERLQAEDASRMDESRNEGSFEEDEEQAEPLTTCHSDEVMTVDEGLHASREGSHDGLEASAENKGKWDGEQQLQPEAPTSRPKRFKQRAQKKARPQNDGLQKKSSPHKYMTPEKDSRKPNEDVATSKNKKVTASNKSRQPRESPKKFMKMTFPNVKRKRLFWTAEEEDMLKEGVHKFSTSANKNIPWRKILEFGRHIFHTTRTPVDLKDKWKNMTTKESSTINKESP
ncbi:hypothetical protein I3842_03G273400 [Carya illinoinensis]|uniref:Myb-like domain-containing protein n=1 Tax=Carya illinoinensis TaxID=32201 RepID=A0A922FL46_CARIL|nr:hypothetical protein I3842_03G273400 [Carya illinoinensis]KAG6724787.1 hypothetical protein I3842_03G273400 [Carya illinoinensis]KAG6724788.1 hypothetical protein I3842_03G273400 [Carya illinoinensis]KAG6724789.1 hypothetical protein I3842_03G273400 [Carya illinoinensis]